ncbi:MAG: vitamin K epoxide reductase family protein, partial [Pseudomonadota bacterium]
MSKTESAPRSYKLMSLLAVIGFGVSCVTLYEHVIYARGLASGPSFCNISKQVNCEAVNASKWSYFLGLPIASYGVFFYLALLGLLRKAAALGAPLNKQYERVILLASVVAALLSVGLFLLSKFVIGALCILCIALYLVNFTMLWSWWRSTAQGSFLAGLREGIAGIVRFIRAIFSGDNAAVKGGVLLALLAGISALAPELVYRFEVSKLTTN